MPPKNPSAAAAIESATESLRLGDVAAVLSKAASMPAGERPAALGLLALQARVLAGDLGLARDEADGLLQAHPDDSLVAYTVGQLRALDDPEAGLAPLRALLRRRPADVQTRFELARLLRWLDRYEECFALLDEALASGRGLTTLLRYYQFWSTLAPELEQRAYRERFAAQVSRHYPAPDRDYRPSLGRPRFVIGYLSGNLFMHPISTFVEPLLRCHDRKRFMVLVFSSAGKRDEVTDALSGLADAWFDVAGMDDAALTRLIRDEGVDLLVDLDNHTRENRLGVFARRAAPVQLMAYGMNSTSGLTAMDYRLTDAVVDPEGAEPAYTEALLRMPGLHIAYNPLVPLPGPTAAPAARRGHLRFGSFNHHGKLNRALMREWAAVMRAHPDSELLLVAIEDMIEREDLLRTLESAGVSRERVQTTARVTQRELWQSIQSVDVALDSHPYGGGVTTALTLALGVPVWTRCGERAVSRVSTSILRAVGLDDWICPADRPLAACTPAVLADVEALSALRLSLPGRVAASPLGDHAGQTRRYENTLYQMLAARGAKVPAHLLA